MKCLVAFVCGCGDVVQRIVMFYFDTSNVTAIEASTNLMGRVVFARGFTSR